MKNIRKKWTKELVLSNSKKYKTKSEWEKKSAGALSAAKRLNIYEEATTHMKTLWNPKWDKASVINEAKKYKTKSEWAKTSVGSYTAAIKKGWMEISSSHMEVKKKKWTLKELISDAKSFSTFKEWREKSNGYNYARSKNWTDKILKESGLKRILKPKGYWTKEKIILSASKYKTKSEWSKKDGAGYHAAIKSPYFELVTSHML